MRRSILCRILIQNFFRISFFSKVPGQTGYGSGSGSTPLILRLFFLFVMETSDHRLLYEFGEIADVNKASGKAAEFVEKLANVQAYHPPGPEARERGDQGGGGAARLQAHRPGLRQGARGLQHGPVLRR
jgi:hypothetical protein